MTPSSTTSAEPGRGRRCAYVAITAAWLLLGGLVGAELVLRATWVPPSWLASPALGGHPAYDWAPIPGASGRMVTSEFDVQFSHNAEGTRGRSPRRESPSEGRTLLVLGDSHAYGVGVGNGQTFAARLDRSLTDTRVVNGGCNGYSTRQSLAVLHHLGPVVEPDQVVYLLFWNDLEDNLKHPEPVFRLAEDGAVERATPPRRAFDPLAPPRGPDPVGPSTDGLRLRYFLKEGIRGLRYRTLGVKPRSIRTEAQLEEAWVAMREQLALMAARAEELDCELIVACLPDHNQVDPDAEIRNIGPLNFAIQERLEAELEALGVRYVDLLPPLRAAFEQGDAPLYYFADRHMTAAGHAVVAGHLWEALGG